MKPSGAVLMIWLGVYVAPVAAQAPDCWHYEDTDGYIIGSVNPGHASDVAVSGPYAYVAAGYAGLCVVDVSVPSNPFNIVWLGQFQSRLERVEVSGEYAFCVTNMFRPFPRFCVIDISDPTAPANVSSYGVSGNIVSDLDISGNHAYVGLDATLSVFDISDPANAALVNEYSPAGNGQVRSVAITENYAFILWEGFTGLASKPGYREEDNHGRFSVEYSQADADLTCHLQIVDISNPREIVVVSDLEFPEPWGGTCVEISGDFAYVGGRRGIQVVDISDQTNPFIAGSTEVPGEVVSGLAISGVFAYLATRGSGLQVVNIADPAMPVFLGGANSTDAAKTVVVQRDLVFLAADSGLQILPVQCEETTGTGVVIDVKPGNNINSLNCKSGNGVIPVAILSTEAFDAATVDHTTVRLGPGEAAEAHHNRHGQLRHEMDVDLDGNMDLLFHFRFDEAGIQCGDTEVFLTGMTYDGQAFGGSDLIRAVRGGTDAGKQHRVFRISPNPFNPQTTISFTLDQCQQVHIAVYDLTGQLVSTLTDQVYHPGDSWVGWHGKDSAGRSLPSATYLVRLQTAGYAESQKVILVR